MANREDLVVVGGGFAGTTTLIHELLKIADDPNITGNAPVNITLLERYPKQLHGGVAYGKTPEFSEHRLNLTSRRATPFPFDNIPEGFPTFPDYIQSRAAQAGRNPALTKDQQGAEREKILDYLQNPPRELYGEYLSHLTELAKDRAGGKAKVTTRFAEATGLDTGGPAPKLTLQENGEIRELEAGHVVLATGFKETLHVSFLDKIKDSPLYLDNNYSAHSQAFYQQTVAQQESNNGQDTAGTLVIGTGLSATDAALRLLQSGYKGKITMLSRNGLEHAGYEATTTEEYLNKHLPGEPRPEKIAELESRSPRFMGIVDSAKENGAAYAGSVEADITQSMQREFALRMRQGYTPEEVLGVWEKHIPDIGEVLSDEACVRMHGQYATWMTTHRVGTTPENTRILREAQESGQLEIVAGFISTREDEKPREVAGQIEATILPAERVTRADAGEAQTEPRGWAADTNNGQPVVRRFDRVISGLGYGVSYHDEQMQGVKRDIHDPLWKSMADNGQFTWHKQSGDGIELDQKDLTLLDASGRRVEGVSVVGVPAVGAVMFGRHPHPEKPGQIRGGRMPPFSANISGITGAVITMTDEMHQSLMAKRDLGREQGKAQESAPDQPVPGRPQIADEILAGLRHSGATPPSATALAGSSQEQQGWEAAASSIGASLRSAMQVPATGDNNTGGDLGAATQPAANVSRRG